MNASRIPTEPRRVKLSDGQVAHLEEIAARRDPAGRAPFRSAVSACIDDFTQMPLDAIEDAVAYGEDQLVLPSRRAEQVLRLLRDELTRRTRPHPQSVPELMRRLGVVGFEHTKDGTIAVVKNGRRTFYAWQSEFPAGLVEVPAR